MNIDRIRELLGFEAEAADGKKDEAEPLNVVLLHEDQKQQLESDISILEVEDEDIEEKVHKEAEKTVVSAAEDSLKRLHVIQMGRCPECGGHISRHLFASICEDCGWNEYDMPRGGPVRLHLKGRPEPIAGDRAYPVKDGCVLLVRDEVVVARVGRDSVSWIEYGWTKEEIDARHRQVLERLNILCSWCNKTCDPDRDGFHMAQVAFGATQERHTFCSDECFEAFRKMYPARVDRDCYERNCAECNLCVKRYDDETNSLRLLAKDYLVSKKKA